MKEEELQPIELVLERAESRLKELGELVSRLAILVDELDGAPEPARKASGC